MYSTQLWCQTKTVFGLEWVSAVTFKIVPKSSLEKFYNTAFCDDFTFQALVYTPLKREDRWLLPWQECVLSGGTLDERRGPERERTERIMSMLL